MCHEVIIDVIHRLQKHSRHIAHVAALCCISKQSNPLGNPNLNRILQSQIQKVFSQLVLVRTQKAARY